MTSFVLQMTMLMSGADGEYVRPQMLVEAAQLAKPDFAKQFRILDARTKAKYDSGHVPGAVWVDHEAWSKSFGAKQEAAEWSKKIGALGIGNRSQVVVYDDAMAKDAARIWFILRYWGAQDVRVLNGGWLTWSKADLPTSKEAEMPAASAFNITEPDAGRFADKAKVLDFLKEKKVQIIDARSEKEHCGDDKLKNQRGGHIPGALHLEWSDAIDPQTHKFKSPGDLTKIFKDAGIDPTKPSVTHCQSGGRASVMAFTLELMGAKEVSNYYRGWSEWGNVKDTPVLKK